MSRRGMTLLELVVGLTVTGIVLSAGVGAVAMLGDRRAAVGEGLSREVRAAAVRRSIAGWLAGVRLLVDEPGPSFRGLDGVNDGAPDDELSFVTSARTPLGDGDMVVRFYVDRDSLTPERGLTAEFLDWRRQVARRLELEPRVTGLDLRYRTGIVGNGGWLPSWISTTLLPSSVEMRLTAAPGDTLPPLLTMPILAQFRGGR
jgi:prepilin-type N-terminal cleavage/methylation domain-containing protein